MATRKLYYEDCHMVHFASRVDSCIQTDRGWEVLLDATAFYPEGGGQACDLGTLGNVTVLDVRERDGQIIHLCAEPLPVGETVTGIIDRKRRFHLMQQHSGEHIVSGIINRRYGYHNVGFHMGADGMVIDFDGVVPTEDLCTIESEANRAVWENLPIKCWIPQPEELPAVTYRSKRVLPWPVRIVEIPGVDSCACCGVHVEATGEIGIIKILSAMGFRGGTRMELVCGDQALEILNTAFDQNRLVSQAFSAKWYATAEAANRMKEAQETAKIREGALWKRLFTGIANNYVNCGDVVHFEPDLDPGRVRELADVIAQNCGGVAAVFSGEDDKGYAFVLVARQGDLRPLGKALTDVLGGRGGGKAGYQQGWVQAGRMQIEAFFKNRG